MHAYDTTRRWVGEFFGAKTPVRRITRDHCRAFVHFLQQVPKNAQKRFPQLSLREAVEATKASQVERINAANVNAYLNKFAGALNWAEQEGFIDRNPAKGLRVADPIKKRDKRLPFSARQLDLILNAPLFTGCVDDGSGYARLGPNLIRRSRFWVPLIALFSGLRLNEICQLELADIVTLDGVQCFSIRELSVTGTQKKVKSLSSERIVPVHNTLHLCGFGDYITERRRASDQMVFPEIALGSTGYHSKAFSQWFSRFLLSCGAKEPRTCFHSFRHNFRDGLRASGANREVSLALGGWSSVASDRGAGDLYGIGFPPRLLEEAISSVSYHFDLSRLFK